MEIMAAYTDLTTLKNYLPAETIQQLTDDNNVDQIDVEKVNYAIKQASDYIDMHCSGRYALPLTPITDSLRDICTKLTAYYLYRRTLSLTLPETIKVDYREACNSLQAIQQGRINLMPEVQNPEFFASSDSQYDVNNVVASNLNVATNGWNNYYI